MAQEASVYRDDEGRFWVTDCDGNELAQIPEAQAALWSSAWRLQEAAETLAGYLLETHQNELSRNHYGDGPDHCSYCKAMAEAKKAVEDSKTWPEEATTDPEV